MISKILYTVFVVSAILECNEQKTLPEIFKTYEFGRAAPKKLVNHSLKDPFAIRLCVTNYEDTAICGLFMCGNVDSINLDAPLIVDFYTLDSYIGSAVLHDCEHRLNENYPDHYNKFRQYYNLCRLLESDCIIKKKTYLSNENNFKIIKEVLKYEEIKVATSLSKNIKTTLYLYEKNKWRHCMSFQYVMDKPKKIRALDFSPYEDSSCFIEEDGTIVPLN